MLEKLALDVIADRRRQTEHASAPASTASAAAGKQDKQTAHGRDLIDILLQMRTADGRPFDTHTMVDEFVLFLFAGHETTAHTLGFALLELLRNPEVYRRAQEEADAVLANCVGADGSFRMEMDHVRITFVMVFSAGLFSCALELLLQCVCDPSTTSHSF